MTDWLRSIFSSITGELDDAYETDGVPIPTGQYAANHFLDVSDTQEVCQLEDGLIWVRSNSQVRIYVHITSPFKSFLDKLDAARSARKIAQEGSAMWRLLNSRANEIYRGVMHRPYRDEFFLPTTAVDVLVLGAYMKRHNLLAEAAVNHTRGTVHTRVVRNVRTETPPDKGKEKEKEETKGESSAEDLSMAAESLGRVLRQETAKTSEDNVVCIPVRFTSHAQVREYILKQPKGSYVVAYPHEYETYTLYKITQSTEVAYMSLLSRWIDSVRSEEFSLYEDRRTLVATESFDPLRSLRTYLDEKVFFCRHDDDTDVRQHPTNLESGARPLRTVYDGVTVDLPVTKPTRTFACTCSDTARSSPHGENIFVGVTATIVREYNHRCATLYMIEATKDRFLNAVDEVLNEYRRHQRKRGDVKKEKKEGDDDDDDLEEDMRRQSFFSVSVATMDGLLDLRDKLEGLLPEAFKNIS